ncbi:MAG: hypothetical protein OEO77_05090 [Acidimicrobiia bacterium]|nr:hypothetical protein [Acidimicrobiia bacterium]
MRKYGAMLGGILMVAGIASPVLAVQAPGDDILANAWAAVGRGRAAVHALATDSEKATGLERAAQAIEAASERKALKDTGKSNNGNGRALGKGRSAEVHAILLAGGSPSDLPSHGASVSELARAFKELKALPPGQAKKADG